MRGEAVRVFPTAQLTFGGNRFGRSETFASGGGSGQVRERASGVTGTFSGCAERSCNNSQRFSFTTSGCCCTCEFQNRFVTMPRESRYFSLASSRCCCSGKPCCPPSSSI